MNQLLKWAILIASLILSSSAHAYDKDGRVMFWGASGSCGQFTEILKGCNVNVAVQKMYLQGFVSGINATVPGKADFFAGTDIRCA